MKLWNLRYIAIGIALNVFSASANALTCENVISVDNKNQFDGALSAVYGCIDLDREVINRLQNSDNDTIRMYFTNTFYIGATQPAASTKREWLEILARSLKNREYASILRILWWSDAGYEYQNFTLDDLAIEDSETKEVFKLYQATGSLDAEEEDPYAWQIEDIDAVEILLQSKSIPLAADYLSHAYLQGKGLRTNIDLAIEYNEIAAKTLPEAKRYRAFIAEENGADIETILSYYRDAAGTGYIHGILDLAATLKDYIEYDTRYEKEFMDLFSSLEVLGYAGHSEAQGAIANAYDNGIGVAENVASARSWYTKAAENGDQEAMSKLITWAAEEGNYNEYLKHSLNRAKWGHVEGDGYLSAILAVHALDQSEKQKTKVIQFILNHCQNNMYAGTSGQEICWNYPIKKAEFEPNQDLSIAFTQPEKIQFKDDLNLPTGRYLALLIGNEKYEYWDDLKTPVADIDAISGRLKSDYSFEVSSLKNASRKEILSKIYEIGSLAEFNDHVLIYYAGHGIVDQDTNEGYWIPAQADQSFRPDWVSNSEIKTALKSIKSKHLLVMADSCYSGSLIRSGTALTDNMSGPVIKRLFSKKARVAITSGGNEPVVDSLAGSKHSVFASAFIDSLENNSQKFVPASVFFRQIRKRVTKYANQTPLYSNIVELDDDGGEFVFKKNR